MSRSRPEQRVQVDVSQVTRPEGVLSIARVRIRRRVAAAIPKTRIRCGVELIQNCAFVIRTKSSAGFPDLVSIAERFVAARDLAPRRRLHRAPFADRRRDPHLCARPALDFVREVRAFLRRRMPAVVEAHNASAIIVRKFFLATRVVLRFQRRAVCWNVRCHPHVIGARVASLILPAAVRTLPA